MRLAITISHSFLYTGDITYFIAVGDSALIYVSSDEGVSWTAPAKVQGNPEGVIRRHRYYALEYTTLKHCAALQHKAMSLLSHYNAAVTIVINIAVTRCLSATG